MRAYLDLFQLRMGAQLRFSIDVDAALERQQSFRRCCLITLVENAIKHGLEPAGGGLTSQCVPGVGAICSKLQCSMMVLALAQRPLAVLEFSSSTSGAN